jgi:hypothetical protein
VTALDPTTLVVLGATLAAAGPLLVLRRLGRAPFHPALAFGVPYFLITTGPAIRWLVWGVAPYGVKLEMLAPALVVAACAQGGILLGCGAATVVEARPPAYLLLRRPRRFRNVAARACAVALGLAAASLAMRWGDLSTAGKLDYGTAGGFWLRLHYASFFLLLALIPAVVVADQTVERRPLPRLTQAIVGTFGLICVLQAERDIALVLLMIPIAWLAVARDPAAPGPSPRPRRRRPGLVQVGGAFAAVAVLLAVLQWARSGGLRLSEQASALATTMREQSVVQTVLGLGSNLFVASRVVEWVPDESPYEWGVTYANTAVNLMPSFLLPDLRRESLLDWFKERYAPTSQTGYGFGMEAEAYLNFGLAGPVVVFGLWAFFLCRLHAGYRALPGALLYRYTYTFFAPFSLYCIRGDSLMCVKGLLYSVAAVWVIARASGSTARARVVAA